HLAVRDDDTGEYLVVGKTFKGLTDAEFDMITKRLQELKIRETKWTVHVKPEIVVEVAHNEVQKSSRYKSGFALRFARIAKFRDDKTPEEADTIQRLRKLYEKQFENKGRLLTEVLEGRGSFQRRKRQHLRHVDCSTSRLGRRGSCQRSAHRSR